MYLITGDVEGYVNVPIYVALEVIGGFLAQRGGSGARAACQATWLRILYHVYALRHALLQASL